MRPSDKSTAGCAGSPWSRANPGIKTRIQLAIGQEPGEVMARHTQDLGEIARNQNPLGGVHRAHVDAPVGNNIEGVIHTTVGKSPRGTKLASA